MSNIHKTANILINNKGQEKTLYDLPELFARVLLHKKKNRAVNQLSNGENCRQRPLDKPHKRFLKRDKKVYHVRSGIKRINLRC